MLPDGLNTPALLQTLSLIANPIGFFDRCAERYGDAFTVKVLGINSPPIVFFSDPQSIGAIFTTSNQFELGKVTHVFRPLTGDRSLIMQNGRQHQQQRQLLMPALHGERMHDCGQLICDLTRDITQRWSVEAELDIRAWMSEVSLDVILRVVLGVQPGQRYTQLRQKLHTLLESVTSPLYSMQFFLPLLQVNLGSKSPWGSFLRLRQQIDHLLYAEIQERRAHASADRVDILSMLMAATDEQGQPMSDVELRDQLMTLLLLGHETTASALAWAFYWLYQYPATLDRLTAELQSHAADDPVTLSQQPYLNAVCKEALRVNPIALISQPRRVRESMQLGNYTFSAGTVLVPCIYLAHRRSDTYPDPIAFRPERFLERKFSAAEYLPFGGGSRSCIGAALALFEMKLALATVLQTCEFKLTSPIDRTPDPLRRGITFVPPQSFRLRLTSQQTRTLSPSLG